MYIRRICKKILGLLPVIWVFMYVLPLGVFAQAEDNSLLPEQLIQIFELLGTGGAGTVAFITSRIRVILFTALGVFILVAVVYALVAAFKYIQSQGDPSKIEEAQKAIKAIFFGVAAMMIAIVGVIVVFVFFIGTSPIEPNFYQTCLSAPSSVGCESCRNDRRQPGNPCDTCENLYALIAKGERLDAGEEIQFNNLCVNN